MNNSKFNNDDVITVVPRIIDPNMKFTKESIDNINIKPNKNIVCEVKTQDEKINNQIEVDNVKSIEIGFFAKYKVYILIIVIIILLLCIIVIIYKYCNKNKNNNINQQNNENNDNNDNNDKIQNIKIDQNNQNNQENKQIEMKKNIIKKQEINNYLSNFILDENDEDKTINTFNAKPDSESESESESESVIETPELINKSSIEELNSETSSIKESDNELENIPDLDSDNEIEVISENGLDIDDKSLYRIGEDSDVESVKSNSNNNNANNLTDNLEKNDLDYFKKFINNSA
jgi:hypothetical protein